MSHKQSFVKLHAYVLKRYEPELNTYYFYNVKDKSFWKTDFGTGSIISALDGSLSMDEIVKILSDNNPDLNKDDLRKSLTETFNFLQKEGFLDVRS